MEPWGNPVFQLLNPTRMGVGECPKQRAAVYRHEAVTESAFGEREEREEEEEREGDQPTSGSYAFQLGHAHKQIGIFQACYRMDFDQLNS